MHGVFGHELGVAVLTVPDFYRSQVSGLSTA